MSKKGRPLKNSKLNFKKKSTNYDINSPNVYPPNKILEGAQLFKRALTGTDGLLVLISTSYKSAYIKLFDIFLKSCEAEVNIIFTDSGIVYSQPFDNTKDIVRYECKIFPYFLHEYAKVPGNKIAIQMKLKSFSNILKTIPNNTLFTTSYLKYKNKSYFLVKYKKDLSNDTDILIRLTDPISYNPLVCGKNVKYDAIFLMESGEFDRICNKVIKPFSEEELEAMKEVVSSYFDKVEIR